ncbi:hypothetical protein J6590_092101 [Homalodisca vitripennis]|nr:hypothetical protein J6590_092360 [Homalodisca vitripennis]KAG8314489.1 hypothetical protein J6590_092101 [Homalodisca vitripennis]
MVESDSESEQNLNIPRKIKGVVNSDLYKRNLIKKARVSGTEYTNYGGKVVSARKKNRSTSDAVNDLFNNVVNGLERREHVLSTFLDLSKVFDSREMWCSGTSIVMACLLPKGVRSDSGDFETLGSFLLTYGSGLNSVIQHEQLVQYADDMTLCFKSNTLQELEVTTQNELSERPAVFLDDVLLEETYSTTFIESFLDGGLTWDDNVDNIYARISVGIYALRHLAKESCRKYFVELEFQTLTCLYIFDVIMYCRSKCTLVRGEDIHRYETRDRNNYRIMMGFPLTYKTESPKGRRLTFSPVLYWWGLTVVVLQIGIMSFHLYVRSLRGFISLLNTKTTHFSLTILIITAMLTEIVMFYSCARKYSKFLDVCNTMERFDRSLQLAPPACGMTVKFTTIIVIITATPVMSHVIQVYLTLKFLKDHEMTMRRNTTL